MSTIIVRDIKGYSANNYNIKVSQNNILDIQSEMILPKWDSSTRPNIPEVGMIGYNTESGNFEVYDGDIWGSSTPQLP